jgi:hypothetical protein
MSLCSFASPFHEKLVWKHLSNFPHPSYSLQIEKQPSVPPPPPPQPCLMQSQAVEWRPETPASHSSHLQARPDDRPFTLSGGVRCSSRDHQHDKTAKRRIPQPAEWDYTSGLYFRSASGLFPVSGRPISFQLRGSISSC